jgi:PiT family inorganic phosphate transporter
MIAWIITIPASATVAAIFYLLASGEIVLALLGVDLIALAGLGAFVWREARRHPGGQTRLWGLMVVLALVSVGIAMVQGLAS